MSDNTVSQTGSTQTTTVTPGGLTDAQRAELRLGRVLTAAERQQATQAGNLETVAAERARTQVGQRSAVRLGSSGPEVAKLKEFLRQEGYPVSAGDQFDEQTDRAVRAFQQANGLSVDGVVGQQTWGALYGLTGQNQLSPGTDLLRVIVGQTDNFIRRGWNALRERLPSWETIRSTFSQTAERLANMARNVATRRNTTGDCALGVRLAMERAGIPYQRVGSAYQAADLLARNPRFREVRMTADQIRNLPAGAVIVSNASPGHSHGHIAVSLGGGREASDHVHQIRIRPEQRVFIPV